ncbi:MAG: diadenosine tetraphosphatase, partial [Planctomycetota bacterium]
ELNALAFHTPDPAKLGSYLRHHNESNSNQHAETMRQVPAGELKSYLNWFRTLPLWLDVDGLRVVHACWDSRMIRVVEGERVTDEFLVSACLEGGELFGPVETLLKGKEAKLPAGVTIMDKDGHQRSAMRVKWYQSPEGQTYGEYAIEPIDCDLPLPQSVFDEALPYPEEEKPVFIGHYWMRGSRPDLLASNVACVDWSVAKGGFLCAYRWDGERELDAGKFVWPL